MAIVAGGCFWCIEAGFQLVRGVLTLENGYAGGWLENPGYAAVCEGNSGHAEAVRIVFDPAILSYDALLDLFFALHDPTQRNRQGNDIGPQYRSAIFPQSPAQEEAARKAIIRAGAARADPVVTTIEESGPWYPAEREHQGYYQRTGDRNPYCTFVIAPKIRKLRLHHADMLRERS